MADFVGWLFVEELVNLLILNLVQDPLQQFLECIVVHDCLSHRNEGYLGSLSHVLRSVLQVLSQLHQELVVFLKEKNIVPQLLDQIL